MNERAKELWSKAVYYNEDTQCWELDRKKFVDSIVSECADISDASFHNGSAGYLAILNHFGVEE